MRCIIKLRKVKIFAGVGAAVLCAIMIAAAVTVDNAKAEKHRYIESSQELALNDLADAAAMLEEAMRTGNKESAFRAAGMAEAYLSRTGLENCGAIYALLSGICSGEYDIEICEDLVFSVKEALKGDGGAALRALAEKNEVKAEATIPDVTEDALSERVLKRIGRGSEDIAERKAEAFCCPNAVIYKCETDLPESYKYSGENIFIALEGKRPRVTLYCFERELDESHTVTYEDAAHTAEMILNKEKLKVKGEPVQAFENGIYQFTYNSESGEKLVSIEIYSDTGRLRKFDAVNYYAASN